MASAQSTTGTVIGTVKDVSGAAVPGAVVKLLNTGTNNARSTMTNDTGSFQFPNLDSASYQIEITAAGFEELGLLHSIWAPGKPSAWTPT